MSTEMHSGHPEERMNGACLSKTENVVYLYRPQQLLGAIWICYPNGVRRYGRYGRYGRYVCRGGLACACQEVSKHVVLPLTENQR